MARYKKYQGHSTQTFKRLYGYKNWLAWQAADELAARVHDIVMQFDSRYFRLSGQMLDSCSSVKSNIAEGYCRNGISDYIRFCEIARGSLAKLGSQIQDCERWRLIKGQEVEELLEIFNDTTYFLEALINSLRKKRQEEIWDRSMGVKEEAAAYIANDGDYPFELPEEVDEMLRAEEVSEAQIEGN